MTVVDRQPGAGLETSFANGGQISAEHVGPWSNPSAIGMILRSIGRVDAPLAFRPRWDTAQWKWGLRFLRNCTAARAHAHTEQNMRLSLYSREALLLLRATTGIDYDYLDRGILEIFGQPKDLQGAAAELDWLNAQGCGAKLLSKDECIEVEPVLETRQELLAGGIHMPSDETGDAYKFTDLLSQLCHAMGVKFHYGSNIQRINADGLSLKGVQTDQGMLEADAYVMALGSYSPLLLRPLDIDVPIYPTKGYSVTVPTAGHNGAPTVSIMDTDQRMVFTRLGDRMRVAGKAEVLGYDTAINERRAQGMLDAAMNRFPGSGDPSKATFWTGLRPMTPDGMPVLGLTHYDNLFLNTGHGTYGWTMACGSAKILADIISSKQPEIDIEAFSLERFL